MYFYRITYQSHCKSSAHDRIFISHVNPPPFAELMHENLAASGPFIPELRVSPSSSSENVQPPPSAVYLQPFGKSCPESVSNTATHGRHEAASLEKRKIPTQFDQIKRTANEALFNFLEALETATVVFPVQCPPIGFVPVFPDLANHFFPHGHCLHFFESVCFPLP